MAYEPEAYSFHTDRVINYSIAAGAFNDLNIWVMGSYQMMITMRPQMTLDSFNRTILVMQ